MKRLLVINEKEYDVTGVNYEILNAYSALFTEWYNSEISVITNGVAHALNSLEHVINMTAKDSKCVFRADFIDDKYGDKELSIEINTIVDGCNYEKEL